jgi:2-oxoglutarate ferredoxin oxidoreductase subunit gamma
MKTTWQVILSGVGGQGLVLIGNLLGEAASIHEDRQATMTTSYGTETRGTFTKSDVVISTREIDFPEAEFPDVVLALAQVAYDRYAGALGENAVLIYDSGAVEEKPSRAAQYGFDIGATAVRMGNAASANILSLGILVGITRMVSPDSVVKAIAEQFAKRPAAAEKNKKIFEAGFAMAQQGR